MNSRPLFQLLLAACCAPVAAFAATPHPLHLLYYGPATPAAVTKPAEYAFLPGQTLAREAIYFDYRTDAAALDPAALQNFDAVLLAPGAAKISPEQQRALDAFAAAGHGVQPLPAEAGDAALRTLALSAAGEEARQAWETFLKGRAPLQYEKRGDVANYEKRPEALPYQLPLPPQESMKYTQVPADFELKLFASEPNIFKPIAMAWDERGRLWLAETRDYPNEVRPEGEGNDDIKICEDTDGDGIADKFTVFADHLNIPTSIAFANGGVIVAQAPNFLFLKSTHGDDKADVHQVLFANCWGKNDTHAGPSNLHWGFDNWLYGAVGYAGFKSQSGPAQKFQQGIYRFRPDGSKIEFLHQFTNNTWGYGVNRAGDVFGSTANNAPSFFCGLPARDFPPGERLMSAKRINTYDKVHPNTANIRQVDVFGGYTAAAGHMFMNSGALPARFQGKALVCEPTCKLLSVFDLQRAGAGYRAIDNGNLLASSDEWMSPVAAEVGPDGDVWVADWYNFIIQHNPTPSPERGGYKAETGKGGAHINPNRDTAHGRIYRLVPKAAPAGAIKSLGAASSAELVRALASDNQFWRLTAQRLLVDGRKTEAVPALRAALKSGAGIGAIHALWTLSGLGALDSGALRAALLAPDPELRRNALRALGTDEAAARLYFSSPVLHDPDLTTRLAAFTKLAEFPTSPEIKTVVTKLQAEPANQKDEWLAEALKLLAKKHGVLDGAAGANSEKKVLAGDPAHGEDIFLHHPAALCIGCHSLRGKGGNVGPSLDGIASRKDEAYLLESLLEPNAKLADGFQGQVSPMPPMGLILNDQQIADVTAFLLTLKAK